MKYQAIDICRHVINYSNQKGYGVSNLKLQKLLYFIQAYFLLTEKEPCFSDKIEAWDIGPVVTAAYREYKQFGSCDIPTITHVIEKDSNDIWASRIVPFYDEVLTQEDKRTAEIVVDKFSDYSTTDLVELTHDQKPWIDAYIPKRHNEITIEAIEEYFSA